MTKFLKILFLLLLISLFVSSCSINSNNMSYPTGFQEIYPTHECNMPCLFGTSIDGLGYDKVRDMLETHPLSHDANFEYYENRIEWTWSDRAKFMLLSEKFEDLSRYENLNSIDFQQGTVSTIVIAIGYSLADIIEIYGSHFVVYPNGDSGRGGTTYALEYPNIEGWFIVRESCENQYFTPDSFVVLFMYSVDDAPYYVKNVIRPEGLDNNSAWFEPISWSNYETEIQDCSVFIAG